MKVRIYLEKGAELPKKAHPTDYCYDMTAIRRKILDNGVYEYGTGVHIAMPERDAYGNIPCAFAFARSGIYKTGLILSNGKGVIDNPYRGEIMAKFYPLLPLPILKPYKVGERICQLALSNGEEIEWEIVSTLEELGETDRGSTGYGDSGLKPL